MKTKIQITIKQLESILNAAKKAQKNNSSFSNTLELEVTRPTETHLGGDMIGVEIKNNYAECVSTTIYWRADEKVSNSDES